MNSARGMGSQGVLTCRDTSSLFNISGDSNNNNGGAGGGGGGGNSQRSGSRSRGGTSQHNHRNSVLSGMTANVPAAVGGSNTGVRASMSKTAREPGEEEEVKDEIHVDVKPQETISTARRGEAKKYYNKHSSNN
jgi:hypothetical protein